MDRTTRRRLLRVPSPAMIVACVALFLALGGTSYAAATLAANSVGSKQLKSGAVTSAKIKSAAVTSAKIKDGAVTTTKVADGAVVQAKIADGAVGTSQVGAIPGARVRRTAAQSVTSGATLVVNYDAVDFNVGGVYDAGHPSRMTAPVAGRYQISASARWEANVNGRRTLALEVNGTAAQIARSNASAYWQGGAGLAPEQAVQTTYKLNAGDYVEVWAFQDSGAALNLLTTVDNGVTFSMQWIAP